MSFLADTNIFSELAKRNPQPSVVDWLRTNESRLYVSAISIGEIRRGIEVLPAGGRKNQLQIWLEAVCDLMKGRVLIFNASTAHVWGQLKASWDLVGIVVPSLDSQIAATAQRHQLTLVTRNLKDFAGTGLKILNPFAG